MFSLSLCGLQLGRQFVWQLYPIVVWCRRCRQMISSLGRKIRVQKFMDTDVPSTETLNKRSKKEKFWKKLRFISQHSRAQYTSPKGQISFISFVRKIRFVEVCKLFLGCGDNQFIRLEFLLVDCLVLPIFSQNGIGSSLSNRINNLASLLNTPCEPHLTLIIEFLVDSTVASSMFWLFLGHWCATRDLFFFDDYCCLQCKLFRASSIEDLPIRDLGTLPRFPLW